MGKAEIRRGDHMSTLKKLATAERNFVENMFMGDEKKGSTRALQVEREKRTKAV